MADAVRAVLTTVPRVVLDEVNWRVAQGRVELPLLPSVAMQVTTVANQENSDARALAELLRRDQAMAAHVLRVVASPVYSGRAAITTLEQAITRLGMQKIREIALAIAFRVGVFKLKGYEAQVTSLFQHSVGTAMFAQEVAKIAQQSTESAFLCGLLHDIGRPVMLQAVVQVLNEQKLRVAPAGVILATGEQHTAVGGDLAEAWSLPEPVQAAIRYHHDVAPPDAHVTNVHITALADELARHSFEPERMPLEQLRNHPSLTPLGLTRDSLEKLLGKADPIRQAAQLLS